MPRRPPATRRWLTAATWPVGLALTSWDYMWRITPMRRAEASVPAPSPLPELLTYPSQVTSDDVQGQERGAGPLFHRVYRTRIRDSPLNPKELMTAVQSDPNRT